jgi:uncharacterized protein (DUF885 family)
VDRYFSNPAQALGYLLGYNKMRELRARAETALGARFNVKDFHAVVIDNGSMPLAVLEKLVDEWIAGGGGRTQAHYREPRQLLPPSALVIRRDR